MTENEQKIEQLRCPICNNKVKKIYYTEIAGQGMSFTHYAITCPHCNIRTPENAYGTSLALALEKWENICKNLLKRLDK